LKTKFRLEFASRFERRLKDLDLQTQARILREVHVLAEKPYAGKPLRGPWEGTHFESAHTGSYI